MITAKVKCTRKDVIGEGDDAQATLEFQADYSDGRNKEWAKNTPSLSVLMTVKAEVAERFEVGQPYTLQFVPSED